MCVVFVRCVHEHETCGLLRVIGREHSDVETRDRFPDEHDWSGRLVVIARGKDILTVLAMTYADSDLIQIQENVIARSISSLDFSVH